MVLLVGAGDIVGILPKLQHLKPVRGEFVQLGTYGTKGFVASLTESLEEFSLDQREKRVAGCCTNMFISGTGFDGTILRLPKEYSFIRELSQSKLEIGAATPGAAVLKYCQEKCLTGLEFMAGIPGNVGGWLAMNAGTRYGAICDVVKSVQVFDPATGKASVFSATELSAGYHCCPGLENKVALSCVVELQISTDEEIAAKLTETKSKRLLKSLQDTGILDKLPQTPMTLALITIIFDDKEVEIPATITDLYRQFVDLLIGKYTQENTMEIVEVGAKHRMLCYIAMSLHENLKQTITKEELHVLIGKYAEERGHKFSSEQMIEDIINNTGLLFINEKDEVQFKHLSFQEYFTAYEIFYHCPEKRKLFIEDFNNLWWQNVALFYAGMTKDAPGLITEILENSQPNKFEDYISNTGGIGRLLQALYNTPLESRALGVCRGLENTNCLLQEILDVNNKDVNDLWRNFSKYQLMQIFGGWFTWNNWSVTLVEPLRYHFDTLVKTIDDDLDKDKRFALEFELFLICSVLASDDFISFGEFKLLVDKTKSDDLSLFATMAMHYRRLLVKLPEKEKDNEELAKAKKCIDKMLELG